MGEGENRPLSEIRWEAGQDWADKNAAAQLLEDTRSHWVANEVGKVLSKNHGMAYNRAEQLVKASSGNLESIQNTVEARRVANIAKCYYEYLEAKQWEHNNEEANHRAGARI